MAMSHLVPLLEFNRVGDHAAPVVADEVDLAAEVIDQGEGVGGEGVEVV